MFGPAFSSSGNQLFFSSVDVDEDIFSAQRTGRTAAFAAATRVPNLDAGATEEGTPFLTFDELSLYFFSTRPGPGTAGDRDLWVATRESAVDDFSAPSVVPAVNGADIEHLPRLTRDELAILFVSGRDSPNAASNIWLAERASRSEAFGLARELPGVNTNAREEGFSLTPDGLSLYFASDRTTPLDMDLWVATRSDASAAFGPPEALEALNTTEQELDPALSPDGFELFFASGRNGPVQLFRSVRLCMP
jgi:Tol biopolymer transport system component